MMTQTINILGENRKQVYHLRVVTKVFLNVTQNPEAVKEKHIKDTFSQGKKPSNEVQRTEIFLQCILYMTYFLNV